MNPLHAHRDDGPLASFLGALPGSFLGPISLLLFGTVPLAVALGIEHRVGPATLVAVLWFVLLGGASGGRTLDGRLDWLVPIVLRVTEYGSIIAMTWFSSDPALPAAYAVLFAVSVHQYEIIYRLRHTGAPPPRWVGWAAGGWELRMIAIALLAQADLLGSVAPWFAALAGTLFVVESATVWIRRGAMRQGVS